MSGLTGVSLDESRPSWYPQEIFPLESHFLEIDGCRVHYVDEGEGELLLFLHGSPTWLFLYREMIQGLSGAFRCMAVDLQGFGLSQPSPSFDGKPASQARILAKFLQALDLKDITMMVHEWSGPIGLGVATKMPERFKGLMIGNTLAWPVDEDPHFQQVAKKMGGFGAFLNARLFNAPILEGLEEGTERVTLPEEVINAYAGPFLQSKTRKPMYQLPREWIESRGFLEEVGSGLKALAHLPVLICWANKDLVFRSEERIRFERMFRHHKTVVLVGAGHYFQEDAVQDVLSAIRSWWDEVMPD